MESSELKQLSRPLDDSTLFRRTRNRYPTPTPELQQSLVTQNPQGAQDRVGVDSQNGSEILGWWETLTGPCFTLSDGASEFGRDLVVEGDTFSPIDLDAQHCANNSSTMQTHVDPASTPTEVLIPEARRRQRRRYVRSAIITVLSACVVAALISAAVVVFTGPPAGSKARSGQMSGAAAGTGLVYFRPVLCLADPYNPALYTAAARSPSCSRTSGLTPGNLSVEPNDTAAAGYSMNNVAPDPDLAGVPSTRPSAEKASSRVLLPGLHENVRYLLGAAEMTSASIRSAIAKRTQTGQWVVNYTMSGSANSVLWDKVAHENFHQLLGIDFDGVVVSAPIIQPTQSSFSSFQGRGVVGNLTRSDAMQLAQAMNKDH